MPVPRLLKAGQIINQRGGRRQIGIQPAVSRYRETVIPAKEEEPFGTDLLVVIAASGLRSWSLSIDYVISCMATTQFKRIKLFSEAGLAQNG